MKSYLKLFDFKQKVDFPTEVLSGLTVAFALVPEAVAFALIAGFSPLTGLYAAFVIGIVSAILGGRPGMISGATGAVAVIFGDLIIELQDRFTGINSEEILQYVFATVILAGLIQILAGVSKLGKLMRLVPLPVVYGFVNGLAIIIFLSQLNQFTIDSRDPEAPWMQGAQLYTFVGLVLLSIVIIWGMPKLTKVVPSSLTAILVIFGVVYFTGIETTTVGDIASIQGSFPPFNLPSIPFTLDTLLIILPYSVIMACVGLIESLLTLELIDEITETRGRTNKEAVAQGIANVASGFLSGMGGCAMLGQSLINISSGARARLSSIVAAITLLLFIMFGSSVIEQVPMAALTGLMIMVAIGTFEWVSVKILKRYPLSDIIVMAIVMLVTVILHNLALAVLIGVIVAALVFAWDNAKRIRARKHIDDDGVKHYEIFGPLFFGSVKMFNDKFDVLNDPDQIIIDFTESRIADMSAIEAVNKLTERYHNVGKKVYLTNLPSSSHKLLIKADKLINVNVVESVQTQTI